MNRILDRSNEDEFADYILEGIDVEPEEAIAGLARAILRVAEDGLRPSVRYAALEEAQQIIADGLE